MSQDKTLNYLRMKRMFDVAFSFILIIFFNPLFLIIAIAIRLDTKGNIIFKQKRVGLNGKIFDIYKFRTMFSDTDPLAISPENLKDERITRAGTFLRKYALDELPQLINILKGDMSFVGPRPQLSVELEEIVPEASFVDDLGADSLDLVELIMSMEEEFDIEIPDEQAEKLVTVQDVFDFIDAQ